VADEQSVRGEEDIVQSFLAPLASGFAGAYGLTDDCAALTPPPGADLVLKTDAIAAGVHFFPDDPPAAIGWKALAVNVSDLAAKGARPLAYLMSLSFPEAPTRAWMAAFADGLGEAQATFGCHLAGGDTDRRPGPLSITIMIVGAVPAGRMVLRGAARPGDRLYVSGTLGDSALGLALRLDPALAAALQLDAADVAVLIDRYVRPRPRLALAPVLRAHATAAMDLSDGLVKDLGRMAKASGAGATVSLARVPVSYAARRMLDRDPARQEAVIAAGDDYEILAAVAPAEAAQFEVAAAAAGVAVTAIGEVTAGAGVAVIDAYGQPVRLARTGWDHF